MFDNGCKDEIIKMKYLKWLNEDLRNMVLLIPNFESKFQHDCFNKIKEILELGPIELLDELDDYYKILYNIVLNSDLNDLIEFKKNNKSNNLLNKYGFFDFKQDKINSRLNAYVTTIVSSNNNLFLNFKSNIRDFDNIKIEIICGNFSKEYNFDNGEITVDLDLLDEGLNKIFLSYELDGIIKNGYLKNNIYKSINYKNYVVEIGFTIDEVLYIDKCLNYDYDFEIDEITFNDDYLKFSGNLFTPIKLINVVTLDSITFEVQDNSFKIEYLDLLKSPVKKWILMTEGNLSANRKYYFFKNNDMISIFNFSNKIAINLEHIDKIALLKDLECQLEKSLDKNHKLSKQNKKLKYKLNQFKSRKVVKFADKIKRLM